MTKSNGIKSLKQAAKLLNKHAFPGESLAYINPEEAKLLKAHGGSGIMTVAGVPSYLPDWMTDIWKGVKDVGSSILGRYTGDEGGGNVIKDLASLGGGYVGWQEAKELSEFQKKQYEKQLAEEALNEIWFAQQTDEGAPLKTPTNVPETIEDVSVFSEATGIPTMKTTAAHGGRIGYNMGGIDTPFQGIGALNPRMGYAQGMGPHWDVPTFSEGVKQMYESTPSGAIEQTNEDWFAQNWTPMGPGRLEKDLAGKPHTETMSLISEKVSVNFELLKGMRDRGMIDETLTDEELLKTAYKNVKHNYLGQEQEGMPQIQIQENIQEKAAHGGRIGAQKGGIMPLLNMGGMEKDYRQDGGFVPIGRREKADDVPARLSKNEFVFTADAVRAAGGGDIDEGAQRMYNVMKNLEAGGEISEQSQGQA